MEGPAPQPQPEPRPLVSICCITFNQKEFIGRTLEGFLTQQTAFPLEVVVHDDASTDGTADIVRDYAARYPEIIRPVFQTENQYSKYGLAFQYKFVFPHARGKYIAFCEGDDYWTDPHKLQEQVDILEADPECGVVYTKAVDYLQSDECFGAERGCEAGDFARLVMSDTIPNLTVCMRRDVLEGYIRDVDPLSHPEWTTSDFPIWLWAVQRCRFAFIDRVTAVFRVMEASLSHSNDPRHMVRFQEGVLGMVEYFLERYGDKRLTRKARAKYMTPLTPLYFKTRRWGDVFRAIGIFARAGDLLNVLWTGFTLLLAPFPRLVRGSFHVRNLLLARVRWD